MLSSAEEAAKDAAKEGFEKSVETVKTSLKANSRVCICQSEALRLRCLWKDATMASTAGTAVLSSGRRQG